MILIGFYIDAGHDFFLWKKKQKKNNTKWDFLFRSGACICWLRIQAKCSSLKCIFNFTLPQKSLIHFDVCARTAPKCEMKNDLKRWAVIASQSQFEQILRFFLPFFSLLFYRQFHHNVFCRFFLCFVYARGLNSIWLQWEMRARTDKTKKYIYV